MLWTCTSYFKILARTVPPVNISPEQQNHFRATSVAIVQYDAGHFDLEGRSSPTAEFKGTSAVDRDLH